MHLGNVFCALLSWLSAKSKGGEWLLRIEDIDPGRSRRDYALQLMDDLYKVSAVQPVDMFPHTPHVENVVLLELRS